MHANFSPLAAPQQQRVVCCPKRAHTGHFQRYRAGQLQSQHAPTLDTNSLMILPSAVRQRTMICLPQPVQI
jgi:hypothetical protein